MNKKNVHDEPFEDSKVDSVDSNIETVTISTEGNSNVDNDDSQGEAIEDARVESIQPTINENDNTVDDGEMLVAGDPTV